MGLLTIDDNTPTEDQLLTVSIASVTDADNPGGTITGPVSYVWQVEQRPGTGVFEDIVGQNGAGDVSATGTTFTPGDEFVGLALRVRAIYKDANGVLETVFSAPTAPVANVNDAPTGAPTINDATPTEGLALTVNPATIVDPDGTTTAVAAGAFTFQWQQSADGIIWTDIADATGQLFVPTQAQVGLQLRVAVSYVDDGGTTETVFSAATDVVGDLIFGNNAGNTLIGTAGQDQIFGQGGNDIITALAGNDTIFAGPGADRIDGGAGADTMWGETGNDIYIVDNVGDQVLENLGEGTDTVQTSLNTYTLPATDVENLTFIGVGNFTGTGNDLANTINGGAGDDTLNGGLGNDTLNGAAGNGILTGGLGDDDVNGGADNDRLVATVGDGNDAYSGGTGIDTYDLSATAAGAIVTTASSTSAETGTDTLAGIESFIGSQGDDTITGNGSVNVIDGQGGNDTISGGGGADTLIGGLGNDTLIGGAGNDNLFGGAGDDTVVYVIGGGANTVDGGTGSDTLSITGTGGNNTLDVIFDGTVLTNFEGGTVTGVESITADLLGGVDRLTYAGTTADVTVDLTAGTASGFTSITGIENATGGSGNDTLIGAGNAAVNNLAGGAGDDTYLLDQGDTITEAAGGGTDSVFTSSANFTLAANVENLTFTGVDNFTGSGNALANTITGGTGTNILSGGGGSDTLVGNIGIDSLTGGDGLDILIGGAGNDVMNGGTGADTFVFAAGFGNDVITGFDANATGGQDLLDVSGLGIDSDDFAARVSIADLGANTLVTIDGIDTILLQGVSGVGANAITIDDFKFF
ncbi:MAG: beta strand repeat-containing protein [Gammaproteobacteria bacterium]